PTVNPVSVSAPSLPGGFSPRLVSPPVVEELKVIVPPVPNPPATDVAYQNVPNNNTGFNTATNSLGNNGIICQLDLTAGTYDMYFRGTGQQQDYSFSGAAAAPFTPSSGGLALPSSVSGNFNGYAFFGMGGKALATIGSGVTVNIVGNNQGGALNTVYYMGNNSAAGNPESKLVNYGTTNLYGNKVAVVNIDNVSSPGNITFVNEGKIIGHADKGNYHGTPGNTNLGNFIFAAFSYGSGGIDTIENGASGVVKFYAPGSVGWAYTSSSVQSIQRRSINNGIMELYGINSLGIATDNDASPTQMAYADIQLNTPIKMLGDQSVGASIRTQPDTSSTFFDNSTWNIEIGGLGALQDATNGNKVSADSLADGGSKLNKVEENIGLNFDFTLNTPTLTEQVLKKYKVVFKPDVERSTGIRVGKAKIKLDESANTYSQIKLNGSINIGLLSDGSDAKLVYNNTRNALTLDGTGERNIMFAALNGGETTVKENFVVKDSGGVTALSGDKFVFAYAKDSGSKINFEKGISFDNTGKKTVGIYTTTGGKVEITNPTATTLPSIPTLTTIVNQTSLSAIPKMISITGDKSVGYYADSAGEIKNEGASIKVDKGSALAYSKGTGSKIKIKNSLLDYSGEGYALYAEDHGQIEADGSVLVLRDKAVGIKIVGSTNDVSFANGSIVMMSNDAIPFSVSDAGIINVNAMMSGLGIPTTVKVVKGQDGSTIYNKYKTAIIDGIAKLNINEDLDKVEATIDANETSSDSAKRSSFELFRRYLIQKAKVEIDNHKISAKLNATHLAKLDTKQVVGYEMNSSKTATSVADTSITLKNGAKIIADRTDTGDGAVGAFI
ncbi:autotransporter-associated N-terminal domain-containing protein, partial [Fusobacterium animalis]